MTSKLITIAMRPPGRNHSRTHAAEKWRERPLARPASVRSGGLLLGRLPRAAPRDDDIFQAARRGDVLQRFDERARCLRTDAFGDERFDRARLCAGVFEHFLTGLGKGRFETAA